MAVTVRIPTTLRPLSGGNKLVTVLPGTLSEVITQLDAAHNGFADRLLDDAGGLRKFVNVFVDDDDVRYLDGLDTQVADGLTVSIIPAVAGERTDRAAGAFGLGQPPSSSTEAVLAEGHLQHLVHLAVGGVEC